LGETEFVEGVVDCDVEIDFDPEDPPKTLYESLVHNTPLVLYSEDLTRLQFLLAEIPRQARQFQLDLPESALSLAPIADQNWRESWKASFKPVSIKDTLVIFPPWEKPESFPHPLKIMLDPGMAFGTGQHETTRICLDIFLEQPIPGCVLDVGTGSGILAMAAKLRGAKSVVANDIDPDSIRVAQENLDANGISGIFLTTAPVAELPNHKYDFVFANIQFKPLLRLMPDILSKIAPKTPVLISGILATELEEFLSALQPMGVAVKQHRFLGHWTGILCEKSM
jgi:ribosomal protein L11 methyltransferase